jgi:hypothetical protein
MFIVTLFSLKFNIIIFTLTIFLFLKYIKDSVPHSFSKLDPDPHNVNADPKPCCVMNLNQDEMVTCR